MDDKLNNNFKFSSVFVVAVPRIYGGGKRNRCGCAAKLVPASGADADGVRAFVPPLAPHLCNHVGLHLTDGLSEHCVKVYVIAVRIAINHHIVDVGEVKTPEVVTVTAVVAAIVTLESHGLDIISRVKHKIVAVKGAETSYRSGIKPKVAYVVYLSLEYG